MKVELALVALLLGLLVWFMIADTELGRALAAGFSNVCPSRPDVCRRW